MKLQLKWLVIPAAMISLSGCETLYGEDGYLHDRASDYKESESTATMQLPEGYAALHTRQVMPIPYVKHQELAAGEFSVPQPEQLVVSTSSVNFSIQQKGEERWIKAAQGQSTLWPRLIEFWSFNEVEVSSRDPREGMIETDWVKLYAKGPNSGFGKLLTQTGLGDKPTLDRFRIRVAPGPQMGTSRIELDYINVLETERTELADWSQSGDVRIQQAMLNELVVFLDRSKGETNLASGLEGAAVEDYATLDQDGNGNPVLRLTLSYPEAWSKVDAALESAEIKLSDRNRTAGLFYLPLDENNQPIIENAESSWGGVFEDDEPAENAQEAAQYQLRVSALGSEVHVTLEQDINTVAPEALSKQLLQRIYENLQ